MTAAEKRRTVCPLDCPDTCSILATVEAVGRVTACDGDPAHPFTRGFLCHKVAAYDQRIYSPDRVLRPMLRRRKGGVLEPVSWDEALDVVASRLGWGADGEATLPYSYGGNMGLIARNAGHPFFHALGASRLKRTICDDAADAGWKSMVGRAIGTDPERAADSDHIVIWGMNAAVVNLHFMPFVRDAQRRRGARLVVVDPVRTETAKMADEHVVVRPGTDAALALGMARAIVDEGLADLDYIARRTEGFERFRDRLLREYPVERCEAICGVRGIARLGREFARARAPFLRLGIGFSRHANGGQAVRAVTALAALVGAFSRGGAVFETAEAFEFDLDVLRRPDLLPRSTREVNMVRLGEALTADDRVRNLFVYQCNPAAVCPDQAAVRRGLARPDLFVVTHEQVMTDTCAFADVVLPACTAFETADLYRSYGHYYLQRTRPVIAPVGESRSNVAMFNALAKRLGMRDPIFDASEEDRIELLLATRFGAAARIDIEALRRGEPVRVDMPRDGDPFEAGFPTPSGRFRFADDSLPDALPGYAPCPEGWESGARARFPLQLLAPPAKHFLNSTFGCVASLVARQKRPAAMLHPRDAAARGVRDGAEVRVFNERGETRAFAVVTEDVPEGVAVMPSVWWGREVPGGVGANALTSQRLTDLGESSTFHCALVEVEGWDRTI